MSKYKPLTDFLQAREPDRWQATFAELEAMMGAPLPKAARERAGWWSDAGPSAKAWTAAGWTASADLDKAEAAFRRGAGGDATAHQVMAAAEAAFEKGKTVEAAKKVGLAAVVVGGLAGAVLAVKGLVARGRG